MDNQEQTVQKFERDVAKTWADLNYVERCARMRRWKTLTGNYDERFELFMFEQICKSRLDDVRAGDVTPNQQLPSHSDVVSRALILARESADSTNDNIVRIIVDTLGKKTRFADAKVTFEIGTGSISVATNDEEITIIVNRDAINDPNLIKLMSEVGGIMNIETKNIVLKLVKKDFYRASKIVNMLISFIDCD